MFMRISMFNLRGRWLNRILKPLKFPLAWGLGAGIVAAAASLLLPNYYLSEARILPLETRGGGPLSGGLSAAAAAIGIAMPLGDGSDANAVDILNSRWVRERMVNTIFTFHERNWQFGLEHEQSETLKSYFKAKTDDAALRSLGVILAVNRDLKTRVITLRAETKSPELSQQIVRSAVKLLEEFNQVKGRTRGGAKAAFAEARLREARREMDEAEMAFGQFLRSNHGYQVSSDPEVRLKGARLEAEYRLRQQLFNSIALSREQALMEEKNDMPILNVLDEGNLPQEKSRPKRAKIVEAVMVLSATLAWAWANREWLGKKLQGALF